MKDLNIVGHNVEKILRDKGWIVADLARKMECDTKSVYRMLKDNPRLDSIIRIAKALDVAPMMLFENDDKVFGVIRANGQSYTINNKKDLEDVISNLSKPSNPFTLKKQVSKIPMQ